MGARGAEIGDFIRPLHCGSCTQNNYPMDPMISNSYIPYPEEVGTRCKCHMTLGM